MFYFPIIILQGNIKRNKFTKISYMNQWKQNEYIMIRKGKYDKKLQQ